MKLPIILRAIFIACAFVSCDDNDSGQSVDLSGKGGSLARFATTSTHLYTVNDKALNIFQITANGGLSKLDSVMIGTGVETIATLDHWLFIGTNQSMIIYDIINRSKPTYVSAYTHFAGCDPVVVQDTLAYVTLRTSNCRFNTTNTVDIINIKNPDQPVLVTSFGLSEPYGLGIDRNLLFVCEGDYGLKILDVADPYNVTIKNSYPDVHAYDVITNHGTLILTGNDGVFQYDYSDQSSIRQLSAIRME